MLAKVANLVWVAWPRLLARASTTLSLAAQDGKFLRFSPPLGAALPVAAAVVGMIVGLRHPHPAFSRSWVALLALVAVSGSGGGLGLIAWLSYCVGDLAAGHHGDQLFGLSLADRVWQVWVPVSLTYFLLFALLVMIPLAALAIRWDLLRTLGLKGGVAAVAGSVVQGLVQGVSVAAWSAAASFLIRPLWSFSGRSPSVDAITLLQHRYVTLGAVTGVAAAARGLAAHVLGRGRDRPILPADPRRGLPAPVLVAVKALALTVLIGGLLSGVGSGIVLFVVLAGTFALQDLLLPRVPRYASVIRRVPVIARLAGGGAVAYVLARAVVEPALNRGEVGFGSIVVALAGSFVAFALLFPRSPPARVRRA
jgi:hypothetical protein